MHTHTYTHTLTHTHTHTHTRTYMDTNSHFLSHLPPRVTVITGMAVSSSVIQTNISMWKRDNTDVPVFGIINFKFVNISHAACDLFLLRNVHSTL